MPFDFLIDKSTGDIVFEDGDIALVSSNQRRVRQEIELTLKTFQGEWFHDINFGGINKEILYSKTSTKSEVDAWFKSIITSFPEVVRIASFESEYNVNTRDYDVNFSVLTTEGELDVKVRPDLEVIYRQFIAEIITPVCGAKIISAAITGESAMSVFIGTLAASGAVISGESTLTALIGKSYANQAVSGDSVMNVGMVKVISASLDGFSTFSTNLYKNINVASISGESTFMSAIYSYIQSAIQGQATVTANIAKIIAAVINDNQGTLVATTNTAIGAIISGQATLTGTMMRVFSSTIADNDSVMTVSLSRLITASLTGSDGSLNAIIRKRIESSINDNQGNMSANINRALSMVVSGQGTMTSSVRKLLSATLVEFPSDISVSISKPGASVIGGSDTSTFAIYKIKPIASAIVESPANFTSQISKLFSQTTISQGADLSATMFYGENVNVYDLVVLDESYNTQNYFKLHEDYTGNTSSAGTRRIIDVLNPSSSAGNYSSTSRPTYASTPLLGMPDSKSILGNSFGIDAVEVVNSFPNSETANQGSVSFWMRTPSDVGDTIILGMGPSQPPYQWTIGTFQGSGSSGGLRVILYGSNGSSINTSTSIQWQTLSSQLSANTTYHICVVFHLDSGVGASIYINGALRTPVYSGTVPQIPTFSGLDGIDIGPSWNGNLECLSLHNTALSQTQVQNLYNSGRII